MPSSPRRQSARFRANMMVVKQRQMSRSSGEGTPAEPYHHRKTLKDFLGDFATNTTAHGIPQIGASKTIRGKITWLLIFLTCFVIVIFLVHRLVLKYLAHEKITNMELDEYEAAIQQSKIMAHREIYGSHVGDRAILPGQEPTRPSNDFYGTSKMKWDKKLVRAFCKCYDKESCEYYKDTRPTNLEYSCFCEYDESTRTLDACYLEKQWVAKSCRSCPINDNLERECVDETIPCLCPSSQDYCIRSEPNWVVTPSLWDVLSPVLLAEDPERPEEESLGLTGFTDEIAIAAQAKENLIFAMGGYPDEERAGFSHSRGEFIRKCSFNGRECNMAKDFKLYQDPEYGNCQTFNWNPRLNRSSSRAGPTYGLRLRLHVDKTEYLPLTEASGIRVVVHNKDDPPFPNILGHNAPTGFLTSFGINLKKIERLPGDCKDATEQDQSPEFFYHPYKYSPETCFRSCFQKAIVQKCGCADPRFRKRDDQEFCRMEDSAKRRCVERFGGGKEFRPEDFGCDCKQICEEVSYIVSFSLARWPTGPAQLSDCNKTTVDKCLEEYREHGSMIEIFYEVLNYEKLTESEAYGLVKLLADFGGQLGLFLGVSVITCLELVVLIYDLGRFFYGKYQKRQKMKRKRNRKDFFVKTSSTTPTPTTPTNDRFNEISRPTNIRDYKSLNAEDDPSRVTKEDPPPYPPPPPIIKESRKPAKQREMGSLDEDEEERSIFLVETEINHPTSR